MCEATFPAFLRTNAALRHDGRTWEEEDQSADLCVSLLFAQLLKVDISRGLLSSADSHHIHLLKQSVYFYFFCCWNWRITHQDLNAKVNSSFSRLRLISHRYQSSLLSDGIWDSSTENLPVFLSDFNLIEVAEQFNSSVLSKLMQRCSNLVFSLQSFHISSQHVLWFEQNCHRERTVRWQSIKSAHGGGWRLLVKQTGPGPGPGDPGSSPMSHQKSTLTCFNLRC